jgi:hypothetical protein
LLFPAADNQLGEAKASPRPKRGEELDVRGGYTEYSGPNDGRDNRASTVV